MQAKTITHVAQIGVPVKDINRALDFYKEKLELPLLFNTDRMAFFDCCGLRIMLSLPEKEAYAHSSSVIYFQVNDMKEAYERLADKQVTFINEPHVVSKMANTETWMVFFKDTEDNIHALMSEVQV